jgi:hypothetical protein
VNRPRTLVGSAVPLVLLIGLVGLVPVSAASAAPVRSGASPSDDDARAVALLRRAVVATSSLAYSGTQVVTSWRPEGATARLVLVEQWPGGRRVETLRDTADAGSAVVRRVTLHGADTALSLRSLEILADGYRLTVTGGERAAGRAATLVSAHRGDVVAARMWVDDASGLLLRQEVNDSLGNVRRMFCLLDVRLGTPAGPPPDAGGSGAASDAAPPAGSRRVSGALVRVARAPAAPAAWRSAASDAERRSWCAMIGCPAELPAGFRLLDARRGSAGGSSVLQLVYGDGLSSISVFAQNGHLDAEHLRGYTVDTWDGVPVYVGTGSPTRVTWQGGARVFTAMGDAAQGDLRAAVAALPHESAEPDGAFAAFGRGLRSVLEWLQGD